MMPDHAQPDDFNDGRAMPTESQPHAPKDLRRDSGGRDLPSQATPRVWVTSV